MTVLIVEDDPLIALVIEDIITLADFGPVVIVRSKAQAFVQADGDFALAILDVNVTDGESYDVAEHFAARRIPVIFVSASDPKEVPSHLRDIPFVSKPFDEVALTELICGVLRLQ